MTCIFCSSWNQDDPNCGHFMMNEHIAPARFAVGAWREYEPFGGGRVPNYIRAENDRSEWAILEHIERQANLALSGGWQISGEWGSAA